MTIQRYLRNTEGAAAISSVWLISILVVLIGGGIEFAHGFWKVNALQHAAKAGSRISISSEPVANGLFDIAGFQNSSDIGDPIPAYKITCSGASLSCDNGSFNTEAFNKIFYGRDNDGVCGETTKDRQGLCDLYPSLKPENVTISYQGSGLGKVGSIATIFPIVTVEISNVSQDFVFLNFIETRSLGAKVSAMSEDLK